MTTPPEGGPQRTNAALAAELERVRRQVESVAESAATAVRFAQKANGKADTLGEQIAQLRTDIANLAALGVQVQHLADRVAELAAQSDGDDGDAQAGPASWFDAEPEQVEAILADLVPWVNSVLIWYRPARDMLSNCWHRHPSAVEAFNALRVAWCAAYRDPEAKPTMAVDWHTRHLPGVVQLLERELRGCSELNHLRPDGDYVRQLETAPRVTANEAQLAEYAAWWAATHGQGQATEPGLPDPPSTAGYGTPYGGPAAGYGSARGTDSRW